MKLPLLKKKPASVRGSGLFLLTAAIIWLEYFAIDYAVADVLNWPSFGLLSFHLLRHCARALAVALPSAGAVLCLMLPVLLVPRKYRTGLLLSLFLLLSVLVITDRLFIRYYADIFILRDILLVSQTGLIAKSIWALMRPSDGLITALPLILLWLWGTGRLSVSWSPFTARQKSALLAAFALSAAVQYGAVWHIEKYRPNIINAMYDRLSVCAWVSSATFHWWDFCNLTQEFFRPRHVPQEKINQAAEWFEAHYSPHARGTKAENLIIIQCEALQYFVTGLRIGDKEVTPNLNRFIGESVYFPNMWSQTAGGNSSDAEFMTNSGLFPAASGAAYSMFADNDYNPLAAAMIKKYGAETFAVQGTKIAFWNCYRMHPRLGFQKDYSQENFPKGELIGLGLSDREIFSCASRVFKKAKKPFFGFVVTLSSHHPFDFEGIPRASLPLPAELQNTLIGNYLQSINYFDREFGRFIEELRADGLMEKTLIVVYGDHPAVPIAYREEMQKLLGHSLEEAWEWKATRRVPLIIRIPELARRPRVIEKDAGHMDLLPTVSGLMGLGIKTVFGRDLLAKESKGPVVFRNGSFITDGVFVEPGPGRATDIRTGEKKDEKLYEAEEKDAAFRLSCSDLILDKNLTLQILEALKRQK